MRISYMENPGAVVKTYDITYSNGELHLVGRIIGHVEDGFDDVTWFHGEVWYPRKECPGMFPGDGRCEIGGQKYLPKYSRLKRGSPDLRKVDAQMKRFCRKLGLEILSETDIEVGVDRNSIPWWEKKAS